MSRANPAEIDIYLTFIDSLWETVRTTVALRKNNIGKSFNIREEIDAILSEKYERSPDVFSALNNSKTKNSLLTHNMFIIIRDDIVSSYAGDDILSKISNDYDIYRRYREIYEDRFDITRVIELSSNNINDRIHNLMTQFGENSAEIFTDNAIYASFINFSIEQFACKEFFGKAIINSLAICEYIKNNRRTMPLAMISEKEIVIKIIAAARLGAWTAWLIGDGVYFRKLTKIISTENSRLKTAFGLMIANVMEGHSSFLFQNDLKNAFSAYLRAYAVAHDSESMFTNLESDRAVFRGNIIRMKLMLGTKNNESVMELNNNPISELLDYQEESEVNEYFNDIFNFNLQLDKAKMYINSGEIDEARYYIGICSSMTEDPGYKDKLRSRAHLNIVRGNILQLENRSKDNRFYEEARRIFLQIGNFSKIRNMDTMINDIERSQR